MREQTFGVRASWEGMGAVLDLSGRLDGTRYARLEAIGELDRTRGFEYDGYGSTAAFLAHRCSMSAREATRELALARSLPLMPYASKAASVGDISVAQLEVLSRVRRRHPGPYRDHEETLVEAVRELTLLDTRRAAEHWASAHDHREGKDSDHEEPSRVYLSKTLGGRGRLDGDLDRETAQVLNTALESLMGEMVRNTPHHNLQPAPLTRGEALGELARFYLASPHAPTDHGNRPHITVVVDWESLTRNQPGGLSELLDGTPITPAHAQQLACDAHVCRLLTGPAGEILDLGRSQRTVTAAQYKALRVRDRHCQWWGCRRPAPWCDAHHIRYWTRHLGPTDLHNLILLCRHHHTLIHRRGWKLTGTAQHFTITRPDGTHLPNAPP